MGFSDFLEGASREEEEDGRRKKEEVEEREGYEWYGRE